MLNKHLQIFFTNAHSIISSLIKTLYPLHCRVCNILLHDQQVFCKQCSLLISPVVSLTLPLKGKQLLKVFAAGVYKEPLRSLVLAKRSTDLHAFKQLGELIINKVSQQQLQTDYLIPIPLHWTRYAYRGYNQAEEIAKHISLKLSIPLFHNLKRIKRTPFQSLQPNKNRQKNVKNVFSLVDSKKSAGISLRGKHIMLVDDLCTTGATLQSAANCINVRKPASISAIVACRAI